MTASISSVQLLGQFRLVVERLLDGRGDGILRLPVKRAVLELERVADLAAGEGRERRKRGRAWLARVESSWRVSSSRLAVPAAASSAAASTDAVAVFTARARSESSFATSLPVGMRGAWACGSSPGNSGAAGGLPTGALFTGPCAPPIGGWTGTRFGTLDLTGEEA